MTMSSGGLPFKARHDIHLDFFQLLFLALLFPKNLVVDINASIGLFQFPLCLTLSNFISFFAIFCFFHFADLIKRLFLK